MADEPDESNDLSEIEELSIEAGAGKADPPADPDFLEVNDLLTTEKPGDPPAKDWGDLTGRAFESPAVTMTMPLDEPNDLSEIDEIHLETGPPEADRPADPSKELQNGASNEAVPMDGTFGYDTIMNFTTAERVSETRSSDSAAGNARSGEPPPSTMTMVPEHTPGGEFVLHEITWDEPKDAKPAPKKRKVGKIAKVAVAVATTAAAAAGINSALQKSNAEPPQAQTAQTGDSGPQDPRGDQPLDPSGATPSPPSGDAGVAAPPESTSTTVASDSETSGAPQAPTTAAATPTTVAGASTTVGPTTTAAATTTVTTTTTVPIQAYAHAQGGPTLCPEYAMANQLTRTFIIRDVGTGEDLLDLYSGDSATLTLTGGEGRNVQSTATVSGATVTFAWNFSPLLGTLENLNPSLVVDGTPMGVSVNSIGFAQGNCTYP